MALNAKTAAGGGVTFPPMDAGTYPTRLVGLFDLGLQPQSYKGEEKKPVKEIMFTYEFLDEFMVDEDGQEQPDKPRHLSESMPFYNLKADKAKSTARYNALDPTGSFDGDLSLALNTACLVTVVHNPKTPGPGVWENIAGVSAMRAKDAANAPALVNEAKIFDLDDPDMEIFLSLPKWIREKIESNLEFEGSPLQRLLKDVKDDGPPKKAATSSLDTQGDLDDEIPF